MFRKSLIFKMTTVYFLVLLLPILCISVFSYYFYQHSIEQQVSNLTGQILNQACFNLENYMNQVANITNMPYSSNDILDFLKGVDDSLTTVGYWPLKQQELMNSVSLSQIQFSKDVLGIFLYASNGKIFYQSKMSTNISNFDYSSTPWYPRLKEANGRYIILTTHKEEQLVSKPYVLSFVRMIYNFNDIKPIGAIMVDVDISEISRIIQKVNLGKGSRLFIVDENDKIIYDTSGLQTLDKKFNELSLNKHNWYTYKKKLSLNNWSIVGVVPIRVAMAPTRTIGYWVMLLLIICLITGFALLSGVTSHITRPIRQLRSLMHEMGNENFDVKFMVSQQDEIGELGNGFNQMASRIKTLIDDVYRAEIFSKEAQLAALKSEINPHFLFNALESIHMRAELGDTTTVAQITLALSKLLRSTLGNKRALITLREELESVKDYMLVVQLNYKERLLVHIDIPENLSDLQVLRFIIQPILENAVKHGVETHTAVTTIWLRAEIEEKNLYLIVENDGPSIAPERLERLQYALEHNESNWYGGIGMMNVHKRLKIFYGENYGISIQSRYPHGLIVKLKLPVQEVTNEYSDS